MRLIASPGNATATQEAVAHALRHGGPEIRVVLDLEVQGALYEERSNAGHLVVVAVAARHIRLRQLGVHGRNERLHVRPQDVEPRDLVVRLVAVVVAIPLDDLAVTRLPFLKLRLV